ncbi:MAG: hypothetical protein ACTTKZ_01600 [Bacteroides sp.]
MSEKIIKRVLRIALGVLLLISVVLSIIFVVNISGTDERSALMSAVEPLLDWTYVLLIIAAASAVLFPIAYIVQNPRKAIKALVALVILAIVVSIAYALADGEPLQTASLNPDFKDSAVLKFSDTGIYTAYILIVASIVLLLATGVRNMINNR